MNENEKQLNEILHILDDEGVLPNLVLIGSWSLLFYKHLFDNFIPSVRTTDVDFYVPDVKRIKAKSGLINSFKELNYDIINDTLTHKSTFISPDGFELEFLTKLTRQQLSCVKLGNTDIYAESIPFLDFFQFGYVEIKYDNLNVKVASPSSYVLQKLLINSKRKEKREKDIDSIKMVLSYIMASKKYSNDLRNELNALPNKWKKTIIKVAEENNIKLL